jgi:hypothetical protein
VASLTLTIAANDDDWLTDGDYNASQIGVTGTMRVGAVGAGPPAGHGMGFRFTGVTLTGADTINTVIVSLLKSGALWAQQADRWAFQDADNAAAFTASSPNRPGDRAIVSASIAAETHDVNHADATRYSFPTTTPLRQTLAAGLSAVLDRGGWASGNAVALINNSDQDASAAATTQRKDWHCYESATASSEPQLIIDYTAFVSYQYARPASTVSLGTWTDQAGGTTNIHTTLDETSADDADYVRSQASPTGANPYETALGSLTDPATSANHILRYRLRKEATGNAVALAVALYEGATQRATWTESNIGTAWSTVERTLTGGEADSITNYADLRVRLTATESAPAAPTYVGSGSGVYTATSGAALSPLAPTHNSGDIGVLVAHTSSNTDFTDAITGWTKIATTENNTADQRVEIWWRVMDGSATDNPTVAGIASTAVRGARIFCVRGALAQAPTLARSNNAASTTVTFSDATAAAANSLSVLAFAYEDDPNTMGTVTGFTAFTGGGTTLGSDMQFGMDAYRANAASGTVAGGTSLMSGGGFAASPNVGLHFVFEPASTPARANVSWIEFATPEAAGPSGTAAIALPAMTASASGTFTAPTYTATAAITLPAMTATATGAHTAPTATGSATPSLPAMTADGAGTFTAPVYTATAAVALPALSASGTGTHPFIGAAAVALQPLAADATGTHTAPAYTGSAAIALPAATADGAGTFAAPVYTASAAPSLPAFTASGTGAFTAPVYTATAAVSLPAPTASGTGAHTAPAYTASAAPALPALTASGAGTFTAPVYTGSAAITLPVMSADATGAHAAPTYTGSAAVALPALTASGAGTQTTEYLAAGAATLPALTASGTGTHTAPAYTGSAAIALPALTTDGTGAHAAPTYTGTATLTLPALTADGAATFSGEYQGNVAATLPAITASGAGAFTAPVYTGTATATLPPIAATGAGVYAAEVYSGGAALTLPALTASGAGTYEVGVHTGAATIALPALAASAVGAFTAPAPAVSPAAARGSVALVSNARGSVALVVNARGSVAAVVNARALVG